MMRFHPRNRMADDTIMARPGRMIARLFLLPVFFGLILSPVMADELRRAEMLAFNCFTCHGPNGRSPGSIPSLHGLSAEEIRNKMHAFRRGENEPTIMDRIASGYSDEEIDLIARYLADLP